MTTASQPAIAATGLRKSYGDKLVLDGIDLYVPAGTVFALLGANGAGKTTAVQILSTLIGADGGDVEVAGHDLARDPDVVRAVLGGAVLHEHAFGEPDEAARAEGPRVRPQGALEHIDPWAQLWRCQGLVNPAAYLIIWTDMPVSGSETNAFSGTPSLSCSMYSSPQGMAVESKL
jgi:energy-coupling factor transporter ATP-binding protein EcfA2